MKLSGKCQCVPDGEVSGSLTLTCDATEQSWTDHAEGSSNGYKSRVLSHGGRKGYSIVARALPANIFSLNKMQGDFSQSINATPVHCESSYSCDDCKRPDISFSSPKHLLRCLHSGVEDPWATAEADTRKSN